MTDLLKLIGVFLLLVAAVALGFGAAVWDAFVLVQLWGWFVVPLGVVEIGLFHALGLLLVASLATYQNITNLAKSSEDTASQVANGIAYVIVMPAFTLLFGWAAHSLA